jgi:formamidopyrimidine-DNA glycosylase
MAKINPQRKADSLGKKEKTALFNAIESVLKEGIKRGGASELAFVTPDGGEGEYQDFTLVYGRDGEPCKTCKTQIKKIKLGGRGTYFCSKCQR